MNPVLIIEDDPDINSLIAESLGKAGYACTQAFSGTEGLMCMDREAYSLVIMDLMLPGMAGEALLSRLREKQNIPVMVVSAKDSLDSKVELLTAGADDYLTKPFQIPELVARVGVQLRRSAGDAPESTRKLKYNGLTLDREAFATSVQGKEVELTRQEFKIMELLLSHPARVFSKQELYDYAWDDLYIGEDKTVNVHISNIRKKLKSVTDREYIETVWGIGYKLA